METKELLTVFASLSIKDSLTSEEAMKKDEVERALSSRYAGKPHEVLDSDIIEAVKVLEPGADITVERYVVVH